MRRKDLQPRITRSALRHGITPDDIRHAVAHPLFVFDLQEGLVMVIGAGRSAVLLEIGIVESPQSQMVVHAMVARRKFLR